MTENTPSPTDHVSRTVEAAIVALHHIYHNLEANYENYDALMEGQSECQRHLYSLRAAFSSKEDVAATNESQSAEPETPDERRRPWTILLADVPDLICAVGAARKRRKELRELEMSLTHTTICGGDIEADDILRRDRLRLVVTMWQETLESEVVKLVKQIANHDLDVHYHGGVDRILEDMGEKT